MPLEYARAKRQVASLTMAFPKGDWLIGNHDALTKHQAVTAGGLTPFSVPGLRPLVAIPEFRVFGLSVGCGIDASRMQFEYSRKFAHKLILGYGVVLNGKQADFEPWLLHSC